MPPPSTDKRLPPPPMVEVRERKTERKVRFFCRLFGIDVISELYSLIDGFKDDVSVLVLYAV